MTEDERQEISLLINERVRQAMDLYEQEHSYRLTDATAVLLPQSINETVIGQLPHVELSHSAAVAITNNAANVLIFDTEIRDPRSLHAASDSKVYAPETGVYLVTAAVGFAANAVGSRAIGLNVNGGAVSYYNSITNLGAADLPRPVLAATLNLTRGDYIQINAFQNSGANLNTVAGDTRCTFTFLTHQ